MLLRCLCCCGRRRCRLLLLVLMLLCLSGLLLLLLLLLSLLGFPFPFLFRQLSVAILSFPSQLGVGRWFELQIRSTAGVVVTTIASTNKYRRLRPMALGVVRFRLRTRPPIHVVHRRRWLRIRIDVQRFNVDRFVRVRVMWRSVMAARWGPVSRMVPRMTRRRSQAYTTGCCVRVRPQGIHVARFTTDLQLVLDEGIVWSRRVRRRMVRCSLEGTPTKWPTTRRTCTTGRWSPGGTTTALAIVTVVGTSGSGTRFRT